MRRFLALALLVACGGTAKPPPVPPVVVVDPAVCDLEGDFICSPEKNGLLECVNKRWTPVQTCLGARACSMEEKKVSCDNSRANERDACREEDDYACALDQKAALVCKQGHFSLAGLCQGPKGCAITGSKEAGFKVACDDSIASAGDHCPKVDHYSCSADGHTILKCRNETYEVEDKCRAKEACEVRSGEVGCY